VSPVELTNRRGGGRWAWSRIIRPQESLALYTLFNILCTLSHGGVENTQDQFPQLLSGKYLQREGRQKPYRQEAANLPQFFSQMLPHKKKRCADATVHQSPPRRDAFTLQATKSLEGQWQEIVYTVQQPIYDIKCWVYCLSCMVNLCCLSGDQSCSLFNLFVESVISSYLNPFLAVFWIRIRIYFKRLDPVGSGWEMTHKNRKK
jgi:hypothetical protein